MTIRFPSSKYWLRVFVLGPLHGQVREPNEPLPDGYEMRIQRSAGRQVTCGDRSAIVFAPYGTTPEAECLALLSLDCVQVKIIGSDSQ